MHYPSALLRVLSPSSGPLGLTLALLLATGGPAAAQDAPEDIHPLQGTEDNGVDAPDGYQEQIRRGVQEWDLGAYAEARRHFLEAHRIYPNARTLRALGSAEFELRSYPEAISYLEQSLTSTQRPLGAEMRQEVQRLLDRARSYLAPYTLHISPPDAHVLLDGAPVTLEPGEPLLVTVGPHDVEARAAEHMTLRRRIRVRDNQPVTLELNLVPLAVGTRSATRTEDTAHESSVLSAWWLWTGIGAVVVGGVVTGLVLANQDTEVAKPSGGTSGIVVTVP